MGAAPAYAYPRPERAWEDERVRVRVVPGQAPRGATHAAPAAFFFVVKTIAVVIALFTVVGIVRVALSSAALTASMDSQDVSADLDAARSYAATLEVGESSLSNPTRIKEAASDLGMGTPVETVTITLPRDVVAVDEAGTLSLSESIRRAAEAAA